jgi:hypothetical protein
MNAIFLICAFELPPQNHPALEEAVRGKIIRTALPGNIRVSRAYTGFSFRLDNRGRWMWATAGGLLVYDTSNWEMNRYFLRTLWEKTDDPHAHTHSKYPVYEREQWDQIMTLPKFKGREGVFRSAEAYLWSSLTVDSFFHGVVSYAQGLRGDGIAEVNLMYNRWQQNRTVLELSPSNALRSAAASRSGAPIAYLESKVTRGTLKEKLAKQETVSLRVVGEKASLLVRSPLVTGPMLFDDSRAIVIYGSWGPNLVVVNLKSKRFQVIPLPRGSDPAMAEMQVTTLAWEKAGTVLVGVRKTMKWNEGRNWYAVPKLYRFDPATGKFTYLGCYYLLGSSLRGEWLLIGDGPRLETVFLMKAN